VTRSGIGPRRAKRAFVVLTVTTTFQLHEVGQDQSMVAMVIDMRTIRIVR